MVNIIERINYKSCPLCENNSCSLVGIGDCKHHESYCESIAPAFHWLRCNACSHVFTTGYFDKAACDIIFAKTKDVQQVNFEFEKQRLVSAKICDKVARFITEGYWLDVGFGNGSLLFTAMEYGFTPVGIDLRKDNVSSIQRYGVEAHCVDISDINHYGRYSVISMADVLEHMPFPKENLMHCHNLLCENGILFVSTPNMESFAWKMLDELRLNPYWNELEHYHNFTRSRLCKLLEETGFSSMNYGVSERYRVGMEIIALKK